MQHYPVRNLSSFSVVSKSPAWAIWHRLGLFILILAGLLLPATAQAQYNGVQTTFPASGLTNPLGVGVDSYGNVFIADTNNNRVVSLSPDGTFQTTVASGLTLPRGVARSLAGDLFIADMTDGGRVIKLTGGSGTPTTVGTGLSSPYGVAVDAAGDLFIADFGNGRVVEVPAGGGEQTTVPVTGLVSPSAVAVDAAGDLFIADAGNHDVVEVPWTGTAWGTQTTVGCGFSAPNGLAVDAAGFVYVSDAGSNAVYKVAQGTVCHQTTVGSGLSGPGGVAVDALEDVFIADSGNNRVVEVQTQSVNFGSQPVGKTSDTLTMNFTAPAGATVGSVAFLTVGNKNMDFADAGGSTCTAQTYTVATDCVVNVNFTPRAPGLRRGALAIYDGAGSPLGSWRIYGVGTGPQVAFGAPKTAVSGTGNPDLANATGIRTDAAGNLYVALMADVTNHTSSGSVIEFKKSGSGFNAAVTVVSGISYATDVAIDPAGNLLVVSEANSNGDAQSGALLAFQRTTTGWGPPSVVLSGLNYPYGVAVDATENVFLTVKGDGKIIELPLVGGSLGSPVTIATGLSNLEYLAFDDDGWLFATMAWDETGQASTGKLIAIPKNGSSYGTPVTLASGLSVPQGLVVDANDNVFLVTNADSNNFDPATGTILKVQYYAKVANSKPVTLADGVSWPTSVALDGSGNIFFADSLVSQVFELPRSTPPTLNFNSTVVGMTSDDSPQIVELLNIGNTELTFPIPATGSNPSVSANFALAGSGLSACPLVTSGSSSSATLAPASSCFLPINFVPTAVGTLDGSLVLKDDSLNFAPPLVAMVNGPLMHAGDSPNVAAPTYAQQTIPLVGTSVSPLAALTSPTPGTELGATKVTFQWTSGTGVKQYRLCLTTVAGSCNLYNSGYITATAATVPSLPAKGATVYARLYSLLKGIWQYQDYTYTEAQPVPAALTDPTPGPGTVLGTSNVSFQWNTGIGVTEYRLCLATGAGLCNLYNSGYTTATTALVVSLPAKGATVYARLYSLVNGVWQYQDYTYTEAQPVPASLTAPTPGPGTVLGTSNVSFQWNTGIGVTEYRLCLATGAGLCNLYNSGYTTATTALVASLPAKGATVYARLYSLANGIWQYQDYTYTESH